MNRHAAPAPDDADVGLLVRDGFGAFVASVCTVGALALLAAAPGLGSGLLAVCAVSVLTWICVWTAAGAGNASVGYRVMAAAVALGSVVLFLANAVSPAALLIPGLAAAAATARRRSRWWVLTSLVVAASFGAVAFNA